jgi:glycosyltransferase involved in cell wall biosynthesis
LVPIVVNYGGPGEAVPASAGFAVPLGNRAQIIESIRRVLSELIADPRHLAEMSQRAKDHAIHYFTWQAKARQVLEVYRWVLGQRVEKPDFGMPFPDLPNRSAVNGASSKLPVVAAK